MRHVQGASVRAFKYSMLSRPRGSKEAFSASDCIAPIKTNQKGVASGFESIFTALFWIHPTYIRSPREVLVYSQSIEEYQIGMVVELKSGSVKLIRGSVWKRRHCEHIDTMVMFFFSSHSSPPLLLDQPP